MLWSDTGRALVVFAITALAWTHLLQLWHLILLSLFFGVVDGFFIPAYQSIPPQLVTKEDLPSANALNELSQHFSLLLGPLLGAACVALVGPATAFAFDGLTFVVSAICLFVMRLPAPGTMFLVPRENRVVEVAELGTGQEGVEVIALTARKGIRGVMEDLREGLGYVMGSTWLWVTIVIASAGNIFLVAPLVVAMPKLIHDAYGSGVWLLGELATASAVGSILAVLIVGQVKHMRWRGIKAYVALIGTGLALAVMGLPLPHGSEPGEFHRRFWTGLL